MSWAGNGTSSEVRIAYDANRTTLPASDWWVGGWIKTLSNSGSGFGQAIGTDANPSDQLFRVWIRDSSHPSLPDKLSAAVVDSANTVVAINSSGTPAAVHDTWQQVSLYRSGNTITLALDGSVVGTGDATGLGEVDTGAQVFIFDTNYHGAKYHGKLAEWFKVNRAPSGIELSDVASGLRPSSLAGINSASSFYVPMLGGTGDHHAALTITATATDTTDVDHPLLYDSEADPLSLSLSLDLSHPLDMEL